MINENCDICIDIHPAVATQQWVYDIFLISIIFIGNVFQSFPDNRRKQVEYS